MTNTKNIELPDEVRETDLKYPSWESTKNNEDNRVVSQFEMWYTERFGWCIPTLFISRARRGSNMNDRTYGIAINTNGVVTMGKGPHVLRTVTVYVRKGRVEALKKFTDLKTKGEGDAGQIRDRISTRRANTMLRRNSYGGLLGW
jgi:hypothetical protein